MVADDGGSVRRHGLEGSAAALPAPSEFSVAGDRMTISPGTFVQANRLLHAALHRAVLAAAGRGARALELHAGAGFFSLVLARQFEALEVVESSSGAVADLRVNLARAGLSHVQVSEGHVDRMLESRARDGVDLVLLDPPRAGLDAATLSLAEGFDRIIYISCNPLTQVENLRSLCKTHRVESFAMFDQFPYTDHMECGVVLRRR